MSRSEYWLDTWVTQLQGATKCSTDRGDNSVTLVAGTDAAIQKFATALGANRTITLSKAQAWDGATFTIVRTGLGAFTLDVGGLKTLPSATAAWAEVAFDGVAQAWYLVSQGVL
jgi:hypothetical protein